MQKCPEGHETHQVMKNESKIVMGKYPILFVWPKRVRPRVRVTYFKVLPYKSIR